MSIGALNSRTINKDTLDSGSIFSNNIELIPVSEICLGEFNAEPINVIPVDGCVFFASLGVQTILTVTQLVGVVINAGTVIKVSQDVNLNDVTPEFTLISLREEVGIKVNAYEAIKITQVVDGPDTFLNVHGWDIDIVINGIPLDRSYIGANDVIITKASNQNSLCEFTVKVPSPTDFLDLINGSEIYINYTTEFAIYRLFTGVVDLPEINTIDRTIKIRCSNRREEQIKLQMLPLLPTLGRYSLDIQGAITSVKQEMDYRLQTIPADVDFDSYNIPNINSWYPKALPDFNLADADVFRREPKIVWQGRGGVINDVTLTVKYDYTRLYHHQRSFTWADSGDPSAALGFRFDSAASHVTVAMLQSAIDQAGWKERNSLTYVDHYTGGVCFALTLGGECLNLLNDEIGSFRSQNIAPPHQYITVLYAIPPKTVAETRIVSAAWTARTQFSQHIEETYTCNIKSTQSITQFGSLTAFANHKVNDVFDSHIWDSYSSETAIPGNAVVVGANYYVNQDQNAGDFNNAILTGIDRAKTTIVGSHRDTKISVQCPIIPNLELRHTVALNTNRITCKGKVTSVIHTINLMDRAGQTTEVEVTLFKAQGSAVETPTAVPARPADSVGWDTSVVAFGTRRDMDYRTTPGALTWNGYIGSLNHGFQSALPTKFIVDVPAIPDNLVKLRALTQTATFETAITSDPLDIEFV